MINQSISSGYKNNLTFATNKGLSLHFYSLLFASFVIFFPWDVITRVPSSEGDFAQYLKVFSSSQFKIDMYGWTTIIQFFTGEALWDYVLRSIAIITGPYFALRMVSFLICYMWGLIAFKYMPIGWALLFLMNPTSIDVAMSTIRNGFAYSLFLFSFFYLSGGKKILVFFLTPFLHSSSVALLSIYYAIKLWFKRIFKTKVIIFSERVRITLISILPGILIGIALAYFTDLILSLLGDRRVGIADKSASPSILQSLFWYILLATQLTCSLKYIKKHAFTINLIVLYLVMNTSISWAYRFWGASIPIIAIAIWDLPKRKRQLIVLLWIVYLFLWYVYWTKLLTWLS